MKPEVQSLIRGMSHPKSNILAAHFDGRVLDNMKQASYTLCNPEKPKSAFGVCRCGRTHSGVCFYCGIIAT